MSCEYCGAALAATVTEAGTGAVCLSCGTAAQPWGGVTIEKPAEAPAKPAEVYGTHRFTFTGSAGEFFRIWIVNVFLTVITLGIYNAWAKVRTRQYFYAHTKLAGHTFDYLANPVSILKGNLILAAGFIVPTWEGLNPQL